MHCWCSTGSTILYAFNSHSALYCVPKSSPEDDAYQKSEELAMFVLELLYILYSDSMLRHQNWLPHIYTQKL